MNSENKRRSFRRDQCDQCDQCKTAAIGISPAAVLSLCLCLFLETSAFAKAKSKPVAETKSPEKAQASFETYQDLIQKAQNLTLQRDRLQTSQILTRAIQREKPGSAGYKELVRALDDLTAVFYTEKAQNLFSTAEAQSEAKAREAIDQYLEALRVEEGNTSILKSLARTYLRTGECDKADATVRSAEAVNAYAPEIKLLRMQVLSCQKNYELLSQKLQSPHDPDLEPIEKFTKGLQLLLLTQEKSHRKDLKKAKALLASWEAQAPEYPEVYYWKWEISRQATSPDRTAAVKYSQLCQNLTPRKRKSFNLDVDLCKSKEAVDVYLKESGLQSTPSSPGREGPADD